MKRAELAGAGGDKFRWSQAKAEDKAIVM